MGRLVRPPGLVGCTPLGVMRLLEGTASRRRAREPSSSAARHSSACRSSLLLNRKGADATVTMAHSRTTDLAAVCREADIVVGAAGQARMITGDMSSPARRSSTSACRGPTAGIVGDVDYGGRRAGRRGITPMPGGTGPMTIACLMENTLTAARLQGVTSEPRRAAAGPAGVRRN